MMLFTFVRSSAADERAALSKLCLKRNEKACRQLAALAAHEKDRAAARKMYELACRGGEFSVCRRTGHLQQDAGKYGRAAEFYQIGCRAGADSTACLFAGGETSGDGERAGELYRQACSAGDPRGCVRAGMRVEREDKSEAKRLFKLACTRGDAWGCEHLGFREQSDGNLPEAKEAFRRGCAGGHYLSCERLGFVERNAGNPAEARRILSANCEGEAACACHGLAQLEEEHGNKAEAFRLFRVSCNKGCGSDCSHLDTLERPARLRSECAEGKTNSCIEAGKDERSAGTSEAASRFFDTACRQGNIEGCWQLGHLKLQTSRIDASVTSADGRTLLDCVCAAERSLCDERDSIHINLKCFRYSPKGLGLALLAIFTLGGEIYRYRTAARKTELISGLIAALSFAFYAAIHFGALIVPNPYIGF